MSIKRHESILLCTSGIDSYIAWHFLGKPQTLYFDLGTRYTEKERIAIRAKIPDTIIDASLSLWSREEPNTAFIPFRNLLLATQAASYSDTIYIIGVQDDKVSDKTPLAFETMSYVLSQISGRHIVILSPFWEMSKAEVVKWYLENITSDPTELISGVSCYSNDDENYCGACPSCFRKWCALRDNGIRMPFNDYRMLDDYYDRALRGHYIPKRNESIIRTINAYRSGH
jgi:7-cyano-7-deazaguanine synthase